MRTVRVAGLLLTTLSLACSGCTAAGKGGDEPECRSNDDCDAGKACVADACVQLCSSDRQCVNSEICTDGLCTEGVRSDLPEIVSIDGDGGVACPDGDAGKDCIAAGLMIEGVNLEGAWFTLVPSFGTGTHDLTVRDGGTDSLVEVDLPDIPPGEYTLQVANAAGANQAGLTLLQGPQGPPGSDADLTGSEIVDRINGDAGAGIIDAENLPIGTLIPDMSHTHDVSDLQSPAINPGGFSLMFGSVGVGVTDPTGIFQAGAGYLYTYTDDSPGTPSCDCDVEDTAFDCDDPDFTSSHFQGDECFDVGVGSTHRYTTTSVPSLTIADDGKVGIGTAAPTHLFHVDGPARIRGAIKSLGWGPALPADWCGTPREFHDLECGTDAKCIPFLSMYAEDIKWVSCAGGAATLDCDPCDAAAATVEGGIGLDDDHVAGGTNLHNWGQLFQEGSNWWDSNRNVGIRNTGADNRWVTCMCVYR